MGFHICPLHRNAEVINSTIQLKPCIVAIDALLTIPKTGAARKADREMQKQGYPVFPPIMHSIRALTKRAISLTHTLKANRLIVIEVHTASTRKALGMPT